jgi:chromatin assembly factor 1 subunit A
MDPPRLPLHAMKGTNASINGPNNKPVNVFGLLDGSKSTSPSAGSKVPEKMVRAEDMEAFKQGIIKGNDLSQVGLIEVLHKDFPKNTKAAVKATLLYIAEHVGAKRADKRWVLKENLPGQAICSR